MELHPELQALLAKYNNLADAVEAGNVSMDDAMRSLEQLQVEDGAGRLWGMDESGQFVSRASFGAPPALSDPSQFVPKGPSGGGFGGGAPMGGFGVPAQAGPGPGGWGADPYGAPATDPRLAPPPGSSPDGWGAPGGMTPGMGGAGMNPGMNPGMGQPGMGGSAWDAPTQSAWDAPQEQGGWGADPRLSGAQPPMDPGMGMGQPGMGQGMNAGMGMGPGGPGAQPDPFQGGFAPGPQLGGWGDDPLAGPVSAKPAAKAGSPLDKLKALIPAGKASSGGDGFGNEAPKSKINRTYIIAGVAFVLVLVVGLVGGGGSPKGSNIPSGTTTAAPSDTAAPMPGGDPNNPANNPAPVNPAGGGVPSVVEENAVVSALTSHQRNLAGGAVAQPGNQNLIDLETAYFAGMEATQLAIVPGPAAAGGGKVASDWTLVDRASRKSVAIAHVEWVRVGPAWKLAGWPQFVAGP